MAIGKPVLKSVTANRFTVTVPRFSGASKYAIIAYNDDTKSGRGWAPDPSTSRTITFGVEAKPWPYANYYVCSAAYNSSNTLISESTAGIYVQLLGAFMMIISDGQGGLKWMYGDAFVYQNGKWQQGEPCVWNNDKWMVGGAWRD